MNLGRTVFSQLMEHIPDYEFQKCVVRYNGDSYPRGFSCLDQYLSMTFAQLTYRESLRDIEACLRSVGPKLYHMGLRGKISRSTLADANERHDWHIYADFAQVLIGIARPLYAKDPIGVDLAQSLYALDSTTIDLCLAPSRCILCWICTAISPRLSALRTAKSMMSTFSTRSSSRPAHSTSWTAATSISSVSTSSRAT